MAYLGTLQGSANAETLINSDAYGFPPSQSDPFAMLDGENMLGKSFWQRQKGSIKKGLRKTGNVAKKYGAPVYRTAGRITDNPAFDKMARSIPIYGQGYGLMKDKSKLDSKILRSAISANRQASRMAKSASMPPPTPFSAKPSSLSRLQAKAKAMQEKAIEQVEDQTTKDTSKNLLIYGGIGALALLLFMRKK